MTLYRLIKDFAIAMLSVMLLAGALFIFDNLWNKYTCDGIMFRGKCLTYEEIRSWKGEAKS